MGGDIGVRTVKHQDRSALSGDYVVEDVQGDDKRYFRRLIFLSNRNVVQSEARLLKDVSHRGEASGMAVGPRGQGVDSPLGWSGGPGSWTEMQVPVPRGTWPWVVPLPSGLLGRERPLAAWRCVFCS